MEGGLGRVEFNRLFYIFFSRAEIFLFVIIFRFVVNEIDLIGLPDLFGRGLKTAFEFAVLGDPCHPVGEV